MFIIMEKAFNNRNKLNIPSVPNLCFIYLFYNFVRFGYELQLSIWLAFK